MSYHPEVDPANPVFEAGLSRGEYIQLFPHLVQERPNLSKPHNVFCMVCEKEIDGKTGSNIKRHLIGKYHILKYKSKTFGTGTYLASIAENHPQTYKIVNGQLLCKVCRSILNSDYPNAIKHLTCKWHVKCEKVQIDHQTHMENMSKDEFNTFLCESFAAAKIPFEKIDHPAMKNFIQTISGMAVFHSATIRELHESLAKATDVQEEKDTSLIETVDHEDYSKPSKEAIKLEKRLQVKKRVIEVVNSKPPKKRKRDRDRQLKREALAKIKEEIEMTANSLSNTLENFFEK